jgi:peptide/nickel transport system substrate-binding protein
MPDSFWETQRRRRFSRRQALRTFAAAGIVIGGGACSTSNVVPTTAALSAPTPSGTASPATATVASAPKRGGVFHNGVPSSFPHLDPHTSNSIAWGYGVGLWYSRLVKYDVKAPQPAVIPMPDLAASWEQPDGTTYIFKIRQDVKWQNMPPVNGRALTIDDILYSLERMRTPGFVTAASLQALAKAEAVDKSTLKLTLSKPAADFLVDLGSYGNAIVARENVEQRGDLKQAPVIGTGAFILQQADPNGTSTLVRNPDYFLSGRPYLDGYQYTVVPDRDTQIAAFRSGNLEAYLAHNLSPDEVASLKRTNPNFQFQTFRLYGGTEIGMRTDRPPFNDLRVRQAVYKAVDAEAIINTAYLTSGWLAVGITLPQADWALSDDEVSRLYRRDLPGAKQLLAAAGLENGFDTTMVVSATPGSLDATAAELVVANLKETNIRITLQTVDFATYTERVLGRADFEMELGTAASFASADAALFSRYHSTGNRNNTKISDPKLDQMIEQQSALGRRPDERKKLLLDIQRYILGQGYLRSLRNTQAPLAYQPYVRDFQGGSLLAQEPDKFTHVWFDK